MVTLNHSPRVVIIATAVAFLVVSESCSRRVVSSGGDNSYFIKGSPRQASQTGKNTVSEDAAAALSKSIEEAWKAQSARAIDNKNTITNADLLEKSDSYLASCLKAVQEHPLEGEAYFRLGKAYHGLKMYEEALSNYERAIELRPENGEFREHLARLWRDRGDISTGIECAQQALQRAPDSFEAWNTLGTLYDKDRKHNKAQEAYSQALKLNPNLDYVHSNLSYSFLLSNNLEKAILHGETAVALAPQSSIAHNHLGLAYGLAGQTEKCYQQFREIGGEAVARNNLGLVLLQSNRIREAMAEFQVAAKLRPFYKTAASNYREATRMRNLWLRLSSESSYMKMPPLPISFVGINFFHGAFTELLTRPLIQTKSDETGPGLKEPTDSRAAL